MYTEETEAEMMKEDPFKKAPVVDKDHVPSTYEIEESVNALLVYSIDKDGEGSSPLPEDEGNSLRVSDEATPPLGDATPTTNEPLDLLTSPSDSGMVNTIIDTPLLPTTATTTPSSSQDLLPDLIGLNPSNNSTQTTSDSSSLNHVQRPPDVTPHVLLPLDLPVDQQPIALDLLNSDSGRGLDLTEGTLSTHHNSPDVTQQ